MSASIAEAPEEVHSSPFSHGAAITRTVAIIKHHALQHRFDIEPRISEAGFEIVKERQMEFDTETDPDTLYDLFGEDYQSFAEGPVWVYVLERRRAVEVWNTLMGDYDPEMARANAPHSLRALYGISQEHNAVMGSPDAQTAEVQIQAIFSSSPPFPNAELPDIGLDGVHSGSLRSVSSSVLAALRKEGYSDDGGYAPSSATNPSTVGGTTPNGKAVFRARALPATHVNPDIVPRMSKAAALRAGIVMDTPKRAPATKESLAKTFANVPGHKRAETICVASTAPPVVAPRMTRAAALRIGGMAPVQAKPMRRPSTSSGASGNEGNNATFEGVPGHKRRESIQVASTKPPTVAPRTNRSASLRVAKEAAPPSSFMFRGPSNQNPLSRSSSRTSLNQPTTATPARTPIRRPSSVAAMQPTTTTRPPVTRNGSLSASTSKPASRPSLAGALSSLGIKPKAGKVEAESPVDAPAPAKPKPRPSSVSAPTIAPRTNKSALLRAAKMATGNGTGASKGAGLAPRAVRV